MMVINAADGLRLRIHRPTYDDDWEKEEDRDDNSDYQNQRGLLLRRTKERGTTVDDEDEERMKNSLNDEDEVAIDTLLFEESYSLEASTGLTVWEGSFLLTKCIQNGLLAHHLSSLMLSSSSWHPTSSALAHDVPATDAYGVNEVWRGLKVVELGSGTGLAGLFSASYGAHVLLSDLKAIVDASTTPNVLRNADHRRKSDGSEDHDQCTNSNRISDNNNNNIDNGVNCQRWRGGVYVGKRGGTAAPFVLDWTRPIQEQVEEDQDKNDPRDCHLVIAADTVWLKELISPFVNTVVELLKSDSCKVCFWTFRERSRAESKSFACGKDIIKRFRTSGCVVEELYRIDHLPEFPGAPGADIFVYSIRRVRDCNSL